ncbi:D-hexose-6-phosphate mutarotase [Luteimonas yindakuii]|uniref:D-hexose-6-phosphate mutarotase n=1 Tax=Luteimonas yindakuii TaxID=2565782 RepID=UPI001FB7A03E|nr:D-hexose-6-phosphate mutarotase [Luteimonas yindakuii]
MSAVPATGDAVTAVREGVHAGTACWIVDTAHAQAAIARHGGQLLAWRPADAAHDVLWLSPLAKRPPAPLRGGVPLCWPWFGSGEGDLPAHGLARTRAWALDDWRLDDDGSVALTLRPETQPVPGLEVIEHLRIGGVLEQTLETRNTGDVPLALTQALHSYFHVGDVAQVEVDGLDGHDYLDKYEGYAAARHQRGAWRLDDPRDPGRSDRVYLGTGGRYLLRDPVLARSLAITSVGSHSLVVWNPGATGGRAMDDVGDGWRHYLCLEVANAVTDRVQLAPGTTHRLSQRVEVQESHATG